MKNAFALGWRNVAESRRRATLTALTVALGVALLTASVVSGLTARQTIEDGIGSLLTFGDVGVVPGAGYEFIGEVDVDAIAALPGIDEALPTLSRETVVAGGSGRDETLLLTGAPSGHGSIARQVVTEGRAPDPGVHEVLIPSDIADRIAAPLGSEIMVTTPSGPRSFDVVGIVEPESLGVFARDNLFTDLHVVQESFGLTGSLTRLDLALDPTVSTTWAAENRAALPTGTVFQDTSAVAEGLGPIRSAVTAVIAGLSLAALVLSSMLGSLASTAAVRARRGTYGVLRATGASARWLVTTVAVEVAAVTLAGTLVGVVLGAVAGAVAAGSSGAAQPSPSTLAVSIGLGLVAGTGSAALGARRAVADVWGIAPAFAARGVESLPDQVGSRQQLLAVLMIAGAVGVGACVADAGLFVDGLGLVAFACGAIALSRLSIGLIASLVARFHWAADLARRRPTRGRATVTGALTVAVFGAMTLAVCVGAVEYATREQIERQFGADVQVTSTVPLADDAEPSLVVDGVREVARSVSGEATLTSPAGDLVVPFQAVDAGTWFDVSQLAWVDGAGPRGVEALRAGGGIALPRGVADLLDVEPGDDVVLSGGATRLTLEVSGLFTSVATGQQVVVDRATATRLGVSGTSRWDVSANEGVDVAGLSERIGRQVADTPGIEVITAEATRARASTETATLTVGLFGAVAVTLAFGALGASSTLSLDVESRRRELAVLRTVGCQRRGIGALVAWDAASIALAALTSGLVLGSLGGILGTRVVSGLLGVAVQPTGSPATTAGIVCVTAVALALAAMGPARRAARIEPLLVLRGQK